MPDIRISVDGKPAITTAQAAERYGLDLAVMRKALSRMKFEPAAKLDERTPLYGIAALDKAMKARPGKGRRAATA